MCIKKISISLLIWLVVFQIRCSAESRSWTAQKVSKPNSTDSIACDSSSSMLLQREAEMALIEAKTTIEDQMLSSDLAFEETRFRAKAAKEKSLGQRILVMDDGLAKPTLLGYQHKVLDYLTFDAGGTLVSYSETVNVHPIFLKITELLRDKYPTLPSVLLKPVYNFLKDIISEDKWHDASKKVGHGTYIVTKLAEYNPDAEFVAIENNGFPYKVAQEFGVDFCRMKEVGNTEKYRQLIRSARLAIEELIQKHKIDFLNFSFSPDISHIQYLLAGICSPEEARSAAEIMIRLDLEEFFAPLYSRRDSIVIQAIDQLADYRVKSIREDHLIDCTKFKNVVRVAGFGKPMFPIPIEGSMDTRIVPILEKSAKCIDFAVSLGEHGSLKGNLPACYVHFVTERLDEEAPLQKNGIGSSFAAPVALSYLIYLKNTLPKGTSNEELIAKATGEAKTWIKDPIRYRQLEVYRLGNLDP